MYESSSELAENKLLMLYVLKINKKSYIKYSAY